MKRLLLSLLLLLAAGCGAELSDTESAQLVIEPSKEMESLRDDMSKDMAKGEDVAAQKASAEEVTVEHRWGGTLVSFHGEPATELATAMKAAGYDSKYEQDGILVWGSFTVCASSPGYSLCNLWIPYGYTARHLSEEESAETQFVFQGRRFASAATEVYLALAISQGKGVQAKQVSGERLACHKSTYTILCGVTRPAAPAKQLELTFTGLPALGDGFVYEGWLITDDGPVTSGRFTVDDTDRVVTEVDADLAAASNMFVLTIEPEFGDDPAPSDTHIVAGVFENGVAKLDIAHPAALGSDFQSATGSYILETPLPPSWTTSLRACGSWTRPLARAPA